MSSHSPVSDETASGLGGFASMAHECAVGFWIAG
jgi:hypothetical protein